MSNIGMERHQQPIFWQENDENGSPCFWWKSPYCNGKKEKIANLWWPEHPVDATEAIESLFSSLELRSVNAHPPAPQVPWYDELTEALGLLIVNSRQQGRDIHPDELEKILFKRPWAQLGKGKL